MLYFNHKTCGKLRRRLRDNKNAQISYSEIEELVRQFDTFYYCKRARARSLTPGIEAMHQINDEFSFIACDELYKGQTHLPIGI